MIPELSPPYNFGRFEESARKTLITWKLTKLSLRFLDEEKAISWIYEMDFKKSEYFHGKYMMYTMEQKSRFEMVAL